MNFSELQKQAKKRGFTNVYFIFQNTVGTFLHGEWLSESTFTIFELPSKGVIEASKWAKIGGDKMEYVIIPEGIKPLSKQ